MSERVGWYIYETVGFSAVNVEAQPLCFVCKQRMTKYDDGSRQWWECKDHSNVSIPITDFKTRLGLDFGNVIKAIGGDEMPGFRKGLEKLRNEMFGDEIYVISRVNDERGSKKAIWFLGEQKIFDTLIKPTNVHFCLLRNQKAPIAKWLGLTHFIDDRTEVLSHMTSVQHRFALNPTQHQLRDFPPDNMIVAKDWDELVPLVLATKPVF